MGALHELQPAELAMVNETFVMDRRSIQPIRRDDQEMAEAPLVRGCSIWNCSNLTDR
jgi:hypothetical protein